MANPRINSDEYKLIISELPSDKKTINEIVDILLANFENRPQIKDINLQKIFAMMQEVSAEDNLHRDIRLLLLDRISSHINESLPRVFDIKNITVPQLLAFMYINRNNIMELDLRNINLSNKKLLALELMAAICPQLRVLDVSEAPLDRYEESRIKTFKRLLRSCPGLRVLKLYKTELNMLYDNFSQSGMDEFSEMINSNLELRFLFITLRQNNLAQTLDALAMLTQLDTLGLIVRGHLNADAAIALTNIFKSNPNLTALRIYCSDADRSLELWSSLATLPMYCPKLERLYLPNLSLCKYDRTDPWLGQLENIVMNCKKLNLLDLSGNSLVRLKLIPEWNHFCKLIQNSQIVQLDLSDNKLRDADINNIVQIVENNIRKYIVSKPRGLQNLACHSLWSQSNAVIKKADDKYRSEFTSDSFNVGLNSTQAELLNDSEVKHFGVKK